jgi:hypothetical protein
MSTQYMVLHFDSTGCCILQATTKKANLHFEVLTLKLSKRDKDTSLKSSVLGLLISWLHFVILSLCKLVYYNKLLVPGHNFRLYIKTIPGLKRVNRSVILSPVI